MPIIFKKKVIDTTAFAAGAGAAMAGAGVVARLIPANGEALGAEAAGATRLMLAKGDAVEEVERLMPANGDAPLAAGKAVAAAAAAAGLADLLALMNLRSL